ncbi:hypothetical protein [Ktedonobacter robiniae]|uniref:hypothetical protein n=1 Tax=Ktedonobacter robiniae TaxID=2778365 RepID=UPI00191620B6|nr:hypothetical protein [Ktedonobacter robiniae]
MAIHGSVALVTGENRELSKALVHAAKLEQPSNVAIAPASQHEFLQKVNGVVVRARRT